MVLDKITAVVPVYNAQDTLKRCVDSLIKQDYRNLEIILVDDGSKDYSGKICDEYSDRYHNIITIHLANEGVSNARNRGIVEATGKYICFLDSDDYVDSKWCSILKSFYKEDYLVMCGFYALLDGKGTMKEYKVLDQVEIINRNNYLNTKLIGGFVPWNKLFSLDVIYRNDIKFSTKLTLGEDKEFNMRYMQSIKGDIICIGQCLYYYEWPRSKSLSVNLSQNHYLQVDYLYDTFLNYLLKESIDDEQVWKSFYQDIYLGYDNSIRYILRNKRIKLNQKIKLCNNIMKTSKYQDVTQHTDISINRCYSYLCKKKNVLGLYLFYMIRKEV